MLECEKMSRHKWHLICLKGIWNEPVCDALFIFNSHINKSKHDTYFKIRIMCENNEATFCFNTFTLLKGSFYVSVRYSISKIVFIRNKDIQFFVWICIHAQARTHILMQTCTHSHTHARVHTHTTHILK